MQQRIHAAAHACCADLVPDVGAAAMMLGPCSGEQAEAIEKEGIRPDVFLLINVSAA